MIASPLLLMLVKATIVLIVALGATRLMRRASAGTRHLVWLVTLSALLLVPVLGTWAPLRLEVLPATPSLPRESVAPAVSDAGGPPAVEDMRGSSAAPHQIPAATARLDASTSTPMSRVADWARRQSALSSVLALWLLVTLGIGASIAWAWIAVRRIVADATPLASREWLDTLYEVADRLGLDEAPRLLRSDDAKMPFACGVLHPTIVLPASCDDWSPERRRAVLMHELAHVRRHDLVGHTLGRLVCALYWFHPLVWTAARRLRSESERACDDLALVSGARASDYAEHLLEIVTSVRRDRTPSIALAMARHSEFEGRMLAILDPERPRRGPSRRQSAATIGGLAFMTLVVGAAAPVPQRQSASITTDAVQERAAATTIRESSSTRERTDASSPIAPSGDARANSPSTPDARTDRPTVDAADAADVADAIAAATPRYQATASVGGASENPQGKQERATLLAKILRSDTSASLRRIAAWGLHEYAGLAISSEALGAATRSDASAAVREMAAWSLSDSHDSPAVVAALSAALREDRDDRVRATAAWTLGHLGARDATAALIDALRDANSAVRTRAIWALGNVEPREAPAQLVALLGDSNERIRELTAWALFRIEDPSTAPALQNAMRTETNKELQIAYLRALASLGERSVDAIRALLDSSDPRVKNMAVRALAGGHGMGPWPWPWPEPRPSP